MQTVLIDLFDVPQDAKQEFLRNVHFSAAIVKTRPGFIEGFVHERRAGDEGHVRIVTTAVWASQAAMDEARQSIQAEFARIGFHPPQIMQRLGVTMERDVYERAPY